MNGLFKGAALMIIMAVLQSHTDGVDIGKCSLRSFIYGGQTCQRAMMIDLKLNPSLSCGVEYDKLKTCLRRHVTDCVKGDDLLKNLDVQITELLLLYTYSCGDESVNTSNIGSFLWLVTKCKPEHLNEAYKCWRDFHSVFSQSRNDVSKVCKPYAKAKKDCAEVAMAACEGLCDYMTKDKYNPFCGSREDPDLPAYTVQSECSDVHAKLECSSSFIYEKAMECEDEGAEKFANDDDHTCRKENDRNRGCLENNLKTCKTTMKLMNDTEKALQGTLTNERLFCNSVSLDTNELHLGVQPLVDCNKEFFNDTEDCAKTFRKTFQTSTAAARQSGETCSVYKNEYQEARECINKAREQHCNFQQEVLDTTASITNPFCTSRGITNRLSTMLQLVVSVVSLLFFFTVK